MRGGLPTTAIMAHRPWSIGTTSMAAAPRYSRARALSRLTISSPVSAHAFGDAGTEAREMRRIGSQGLRIRLVVDRIA